MGSKTFVIISVSDRIVQLNDLLKSIINNAKFDDYDINILYQDYLGNVDQIIKTKRITNIFVAKERLGCNLARIELVKRIKYDFYVNLDDDMLLTEYTSYDEAIKKCMDPTTGFVLTNWARSESILKNKVPKMKNAFVKQVFIYQGGGMVYSDKIAELVRGMEAKRSVFDEGWSLISYLNGYTNYRYLGSLALHFICTNGGMRDFYKKNYDNLELTNTEWINYRKGKDGHWCIPLDSDLKECAKTEHKNNLKGVTK